MANNKPLRIIIAEDEYLILMGIRSALKSFGYNVIGEATNGEEAVEIALVKKPDLLIMDINLPKLDGIEAIKKINEQYMVPSIIVTGYNNENLIKKAKDVGVYGYLVKPVNKAELKATIEVVMNKFSELKKINDKLDNAEKALEDRKYIERAKGLLMDNYNMKESQAMKKLQSISRNKNMKLVSVARKIIEANDILKID